eukprot:scpid68255/ scgid29414/ 
MAKSVLSLLLLVALVAICSTPHGCEGSSGLGTTSPPTQGPPPPSCMHWVLVTIGVSPTAAYRMEDDLARSNWTEEHILSSSNHTLAQVLQSPAAVADSLQRCLNRESAACALAQCQHGGTCDPDHSTQQQQQQQSYSCNCTDFYTGVLCNIEDSEASEELRLLQAKVTAQKNLITRIVRRLTDVTKAVRMLRVRQQFVKKTYLRTLDTALLYLLPCSRQYLGYQYMSVFNTTAISTSRPIAQMTFRKKELHTVLRITYSTSLRIQAASTGDFTTRWFFKIGNSDCLQPARIEMILHQPASTRNLTIPVNIAGMCEETSEGWLDSGNHRISLYAVAANNQSLDFVEHRYPSTALFEVQELCKTTVSGLNFASLEQKVTADPANSTFPEPIPEPSDNALW